MEVGAEIGAEAGAEAGGRLMPQTQRKSLTKRADEQWQLREGEREGETGKRTAAAMRETRQVSSTWIRSVCFAL